MYYARKPSKTDDCLFDLSGIGLQSERAWHFCRNSVLAPILRPLLQLMRWLKVPRWMRLLIFSFLAILVPYHLFFGGWFRASSARSHSVSGFKIYQSSHSYSPSDSPINDLSLQKSIGELDELSSIPEDKLPISDDDEDFEHKYEEPPAKLDFDLLDLVTVGIKTFMRPSCAMHLVKTLLSRYPGIMVVLVNDGLEKIDFLDVLKSSNDFGRIYDVENSPLGFDSEFTWNLNDKSASSPNDQNVHIKTLYTELEDAKSFTHEQQSMFQGFLAAKKAFLESRSVASSPAKPPVSIIHQVKIPFDSGVSVGRNVLVQSCQTKYLLMTDDDYEINDHSDLKLMTEVLEYSELFNQAKNLADNDSGEKSQQFKDVLDQLGMYSKPNREGNYVRKAEDAFLTMPSPFYSQKHDRVDIVGGIRKDSWAKKGREFTRGAFFAVDKVEVGSLGPDVNHLNHRLASRYREPGLASHQVNPRQQYLTRLRILPSRSSTRDAFSEKIFNVKQKSHPINHVWIQSLLRGNCLPVDFVQQFFMARVSSLRNQPNQNLWDPHLKNNDHYDFFLRASSFLTPSGGETDEQLTKASNMKLYSPSSLSLQKTPPIERRLVIFGCSEISYFHSKTEKSRCKLETETNKHLRTKTGDFVSTYGQFRNRWIMFVPYLFRKWSIGMVHDKELGKRIMIITSDSQKDTLDSKSLSIASDHGVNSPSNCKVLHWRRNKKHNQEMEFECSKVFPEDKQLL